MVYCGKPSKSCVQCRKRDIKCDKKRESCGQCLRANLICPGYSNPGQIMIRDQTRAVIAKAAFKPPTLSEPFSGRPLLPCLEDRAKVLFATREVQRFPYLRYFYNAKQQSKPLYVAVRAVALVYLAVEISSFEILQQARVRYGSALALVNEALKSEEGAGDNAVLLAVIFLALFERSAQRFEGASPSTGGKVEKHLDGALVLFKIAGKSQFGDAMRLDMFHHLSMDILLNCLKFDFELPPDLLLLHQFADRSDRRWEVADMIIRFIHLRDRQQNGKTQDLQVKADEINVALANMGTSCAFCSQKVARGEPDKIAAKLDYQVAAK